MKIWQLLLLFFVFALLIGFYSQSLVVGAATFLGLIIVSAYVKMLI